MAALALTWTSALGFTPSGAAPGMRRSTSSRPVARLVAEAKLPAPALLSLPDVAETSWGVRPGASSRPSASKYRALMAK